MKKSKIMRYTASGILAVSVLLLFLPYREDWYGKSYNGIEMINYAKEYLGNGYNFEMILRFIVPVVFCVIAAIVLLVKNNNVTCIVAFVLSLIAFILYTAYIGEYQGDSLGIEIGLQLNYFIPIIGMVLPALIMYFDVKEKSVSNTKVNVTSENKQID